MASESSAVIRKRRTVKDVRQLAKRLGFGEVTVRPYPWRIDVHCSVHTSLSVMHVEGLQTRWEAADLMYRLLETTARWMGEGWKVDDGAA